MKRILTTGLTVVSPLVLLVCTQFTFRVIAAPDHQVEEAEQGNLPTQQIYDRPAPPSAAWGRLFPRRGEASDGAVAGDTESTRDSENQVPAVTPSEDVGSNAITTIRSATYYRIAPGDTLNEIALAQGIAPEELVSVNRIQNVDALYAGQVLVIPGSDGALPDPALAPVVTGSTVVTLAARGTITERMTLAAQAVEPGSPFYEATWLTYYGRPGVPIMGILGEHAIEDLAPLLHDLAEEYDRANGEALAVTPAYHLVYGMATKAAGDDASHLAFLDDEAVNAYIESAEAEGFAVILDVQIGALEPVEAIRRALPFLDYPHVHLAIDPEFAMSHPGQAWPGDPIGFVTAEQVNAVQEAIDAYLVDNELPGPRILLLHMFQQSMVVDPELLESSYEQIALTISADGWGGPWGKISKYNAFVTKETPFSAFKLFFRWDEPLLNPHEALGEHPHTGTDFFIEVTPNLLIYQ